MKRYILLSAILFLQQTLHAQKSKFNKGWLFRVDTANYWDDRDIWDRKPVPVTLPHDWNIELPFEQFSPSGNRGAALRGGLGIYEKKFTLSETDRNKNIFIIFDGVYMNSTVIINGQTLGNRPFGYISFEYDMTPFLKFDGTENHLMVRVENKQPNSRWYSGSGIYRNVWLDKRGPMYVKNWGTYVTTPVVQHDKAEIKVITTVVSQHIQKDCHLKTSLLGPSGQIIATRSDTIPSFTGTMELMAQFKVSNPTLWSTQQPGLYKIISEITSGKNILNSYHTAFGIRNFAFSQQTGFTLNGEHMKIIGTCMHHDLGALGVAINTAAMERQLRILKDMGINGIRTSHNPPAPEWLDLCDKMGFLVMDETFDVWTWDKENTPFNYNLYFHQWYQRDLTDHIVRDRNHPSIIMWSIGNEIPEQHGSGADTLGRKITRSLVNIIKNLDPTRAVTAGLNFANNTNNMYLSDALDIIGVNYHHREWKDLGSTLFNSTKPYLLSENTSALATRGHYDFPSDSIRRWSGFTTSRPGGNANFTCSSLENCSAPWASTNEEALKLFLKYPFLSGMYLWTGFDYLGEPTPYPYPARSSYFGVVDMAGFPKDAYYLYKSIFTRDTVLHILPHWNWQTKQRVDVHVYYNMADEVQLFLNGRSIGKKKKVGDDLFVRFNGITFEPGQLKAVSRYRGKKIAQQVVNTAGAPYQLIASVERSDIQANGEDLNFVKVAIVDKAGNIVPNADHTLQFDISGPGNIAALDNGSQTDLEPFSNKKFRKAFNGLGLAIVKSTQQAGTIYLRITAQGLRPAAVALKSVK
jgi:beta-galactosidase